MTETSTSLVAVADQESASAADTSANPVALAQPAAAAVPAPQNAGGDERLLASHIASTMKKKILAGFIVLIVGLGGFGAWAALAPLKGALVVPGVVKVAGERKTVQHLEGGIIDKIHVQDGETVKAGQLLISLDETRASTSLQLLRGQYYTLAARQARLLTERDGLPKMVFPAELDTDNDPELQKIFAGEEGLFQTRRKALIGQIEIQRQRIGQFEEEIKGLVAQKQSNAKQLALINEELSAVKKIYEQGIYEKPKYLALQRNAAKLEGEVGDLAAQIARVNQQIAETQLRIIDLQNQRLAEVNKDLREVQSSLLDNAERRRQAMDVLARVDIRAPYAGTVVGLRFHTEKGVIPAGAAILDIVPGDDKLIIESRINTLDIDTVQPGLPAEIHLVVYNQRTTPSVDGEVLQVSADRLTDEKNNPYYQALVKVDPASLQALHDVKLYPGMPVEVYIITGERTLLQYVMKPITDSFQRALREK